MGQSGSKVDGNEVEGVAKSIEICCKLGLDIQKFAETCSAPYTLHHSLLVSLIHIRISVKKHEIFSR